MWAQEFKKKKKRHVDIVFKSYYSVCAVVLVVSLVHEDQMEKRGDEAWIKVDKKQTIKREDIWEVWKGDKRHFGEGEATGASRSAELGRAVAQAGPGAAARLVS